MPDKLATSEKCPGCWAQCQGTLWHAHGRTYEDLNCGNCKTSWGRIDKGTWHNMTEMGIPFQVAEQIHKGVVKA